MPTLKKVQEWIRPTEDTTRGIKPPETLPHGWRGKESTMHAKFLYINTKMYP